MKKVSLSKMTNEELVARYVEIGAAQAEALDDFDNPRYNRLYDKKIAVVNELRSRPGDQRRLLISLFDHPNRQVRLNAAESAYMLDRANAHAVLQEIAASRWQPQAGRAGMALSGIERGTSLILKDFWIPVDKKERAKAVREAQAKQLALGRRLPGAQ
jgi:hypothetical protein